MYPQGKQEKTIGFIDMDSQMPKESPELPIDKTPSYYEVKSGDTLTNIASQLSSSVQELAKKSIRR